MLLGNLGDDYECVRLSVFVMSCYLWECPQLQSQSNLTLLIISEFYLRAYIKT